MSTLEGAFEKKIKRHVMSIKFWMREDNLTVDEAISRVRAGSCLGATTWDEIERRVKQ
ncbi:hypothetical protein [Paenibacillus agilis]|uniref:hypothetical protein n=1 Tax=Paenibacillus agilis TaxID=3020863 RepID=UPI0016498C93|nr:hypothetical protein [Paenibacillus agilis]